MTLVIAMCAIHLRFYGKFTLKKKFKERRGRDFEKVKFVNYCNKKNLNKDVRRSLSLEIDLFTEKKKN